MTDLRPQGLAESLAATPTNVGRLRRAARCWLASVIAVPDDVDALTLAISEALENAVDHAFVGREPGTMTLSGRVLPDDLVEISVADDGRWRRPGDPGHRGRGLDMIVALCASHALVTGSAGTRLTMRYEPS